MELSDKEKAAIIEYRIQKSFSVLIEAEDNARLCHWSLTANRLYYAVFHMASALLTDKGISAKTHTGVIGLIGKEFVQKNLLNTDDAKLISRLQNMRQSGDYDDMFDWSENDVAPLIEPTKQLLDKMHKMLKTAK